MKISVVSGMCKRADAISEAANGTVRAVTERLGWSCRLFTYACDYEDLDVKIVADASDILLDRHFLDSDFVIFHFGIYSQLFNAILLGNGRATQIVYYHNITPKELMPREKWPVIEKSLRQMANIEAADRVWAVSSFNKKNLVEYGIPPSRIEIMPLYVKPSFHFAGRADKSCEAVQVLYVGRFIASKGVTDLMQAVAVASNLTDKPFSVDLVGNLTLSDPVYLDQLKSLIERLGIGEIINLLGEVDDDEIAARYRAAHIFAIASHHEGFCVPLVEAMQAKCLPIAYATGNIPDLISGFGELVRPGDWRDFGKCLARYIDFFGAHLDTQSAPLPLPRSTDALDVAAFDRSTERHLKAFSYEAFGERVVMELTRRARPSGD